MFEVVAYAHFPRMGKSRRNAVQVAAGVQDRSSGFHTGYKLGIPNSGNRFYMDGVAEIIVYIRAFDGFKSDSLEFYIFPRSGASRYRMIIAQIEGTVNCPP